MKIIIHKTNVKFPRAPTVRPMIEMIKFSAGHDLASLNTLSCNAKLPIRNTQCVCVCVVYTIRCLIDGGKCLEVKNANTKYIG